MVAANVENANDKICELEDTIQILQQDKLKNNVCISGAPIDAARDTTEIVKKIAKALGVTLTPADFTSYPVTNGKFIIASFDRSVHKQLLMNKVRVKRSLMVEEVFGAGQRSNSQIYINDHLTKHFNQLFLTARAAVKDGKLATASSIGGKIRVRKSKGDFPRTIYNLDQLQMEIDAEIDNRNLTEVNMPQQGDQTATGGTKQRNKRGRKPGSTSASQRVAKKAKGTEGEGTSGKQN